ncbi:hypothetical protein QAD02_016881 [Eretmocerus hayati]|uniref:Uncharacterized protein n=1 Tax=Eretmocerus hayati TaxID=131215 RepID=A0ACC2PEU4_9HYME|nr:hypothetical protein QAD02_016881 [Eretmocerus hayati]
MSKSSLISPFKSLDNLYHSTNYEVLVMNQTVVFDIFQQKDEGIINQIIDAGRVRYFQLAESLFEEACLSRHKTAVLSQRYLYALNYDHHLPCDLEPTGKSYRENCIVAFVPRGFTFKKPLNYGILKLNEVGIISAVKKRWLGDERPHGIRPYFPIELGYVYLPLMIYIIGFFISLTYGVLYLPPGGSKPKGIIGDLWEVLSDLLNFTVIVKLPQQIENETFYDCISSNGLLMKKCMITGVSGIESTSLARDFIHCYFRDGLGLFIKRDFDFKVTWMFDLFSRELWLCILLTLFLSSILSWAMIRIDAKYYEIQSASSFADILFSHFGALCHQGQLTLYDSREHDRGLVWKVQIVFEIPGKDLEILQGHRQLWTLSINLFSLLLTYSYSSLIYILMSKSSLVPPFKDLNDLFHNTNYDVLIMNHGLVNAIFENQEEPVITKIIRADRVNYYNSSESLFRAACTNSHISAAFHLGYQYAINHDHHLPCNLEPTGEFYRRSCVTAIIPRNFEFKKPLNYGILRLHEVGIVSAVQRRWLGTKTTSEMRPYFSVELGYVYLPLMIYISGFSLSIIVFIAEINVTHVKFD